MWRENLTPLKLIGIVISLVGVSLILSDGNLNTLISKGIVRGDLFILGCVGS